MELALFLCYSVKSELLHESDQHTCNVWTRDELWLTQRTCHMVAQCTAILLTIGSSEKHLLAHIVYISHEQLQVAHLPCSLHVGFCCVNSTSHNSSALNLWHSDVPKVSMHTASMSAAP